MGPPCSCPLLSSLFPLSLPPHPFIPSPIHPAAAVLWPSLSLCHKKFLPLFLHLSLRHKDGWRRSWNGLHNRLCHKVSSLSCIRLSAAFFSSYDAPHPTGVCVCVCVKGGGGGLERHSMATDAFVRPKV